MPPTLPSATTTIDDQAGAVAAGLDSLCVMAPVATNADATPRFFANSQAILDLHGYAPGVDYCALHLEATGKPVLFVGLPIATAGAISREDTSGNSGTCVTSLAAGGDGTLEETDGVLRIPTGGGGTIGTDQIALELSLDGGRTYKKVRLGTANSYAIPYVGITISFAAGTLVAGDTVHTWHSSAPLWNSAGLASARAALAAQQKLSRSWLVVGDLSIADDANNVVTQVNAYETSNDRFVYARTQLRDRLPVATMSRTQVRMTGNPNLTFAEVGPTGDTITRSAGSWITDGFVAGMVITIAGSASNNMTTAAAIATVTATVITLDTDDLTDEGPVGDVTVTGTHALTFAEVGATGDTITRSGGSWLTDGFRVGDNITIADTVSNDGTTTAGIVTVTATVITLDTDDLVDEVIGSYGVTITAGETKAQHVAALDALMSSVASEKRIDIAIGRARKLSPILQYRFRRPAAWAASIREYSHDVHIPTWRKSDGPLSGWDLFDTADNLVEFDERVDGGALAAGFTCLRTWANGPEGTFVAMSLTRADENSLLSRTHNMAVANVACSVNQAETENAVGQVLQLNDDGTASPESLKKIEGRINTALENALLQNRREGKRASSAVWRANTTDILNVVSATLTGVLTLNLNGTLEHIETTVKIQSGGEAA